MPTLHCRFCSFSGSLFFQGILEGGHARSPSYGYTEDELITFKCRHLAFNVICLISPYDAFPLSLFSSLILLLCFSLILFPPTFPVLWVSLFPICCSIVPPNGTVTLARALFLWNMQLDCKKKTAGEQREENRRKVFFQRKTQNHLVIVFLILTHLFAAFQ